MFFIVFDMLLRSIAPLIELTIEKQIHIFIMGERDITMKFSITDKKIIIPAFEIEAVEIAPVIIYIVAIIGANAFIVLHNEFIYVILIVVISSIIEKIEIDTHKQEQREKAFFIPSDSNEDFIVLKIDIIMVNTRKKEKFFNIDGREDKRYSNI